MLCLTATIRIIQHFHMRFMCILVLAISVHSGAFSESKGLSSIAYQLHSGNMEKLHLLSVDRKSDSALLVDYGLDPTLSADGKWILFSTGTSIRRLNIDTSETAILIESYGLNNPRWAGSQGNHGDFVYEQDGAIHLGWQDITSEPTLDYYPDL
jgi:hypothetical protein